MGSTPAVDELRRAQRAEGPATVLAIGTANPANCVAQEDYADFYCRVTNTGHVDGLKHKLNALCVSASGSQKRFFYHTEEMISAHPEFVDRAKQSLDARLELTVLSFREPDRAHTVTCQALFGDGAGAVIVGADAVRPVEHPMFEIVSVGQTLIPGTEHVITMQLTEHGLDGDIAAKELVPLAADNVEQCLHDALGPLCLDGGEWNDLFWVVHPGSPLILDHIERALGLKQGKLAASRKVLREYGNMLGSTLIFVLDEQRRRMEEEGDGAEWGVMMGFGPGFTIETMVLHAPERRNKN
uniref:Chalcone/stilbene synthase C-terminal domain-containing protein n=1 Tax=Oryza brachyantha TaxID=4533 RepID=J3MLH3_ORYBR